MSRDNDTLQDILNAAQHIQDFVHGFGKESFLDDWKTRSADVPDLQEKTKKLLS